MRCSAALHPYTRALLAAVPTLDPHSEPQALVQARSGSANPPPAAAFHPAARWPANVAAESLRRCARWPRAIGSPVIGSHPERGRWGYLFLNNRPIVRGSADLLSAPSCETRDK